MKQRLAMIMLAVVLAVSQVGPLWAQDATGRAQLLQFAEGMTSLTAHFQQRVLTSEGRIEDQSEGRVWLSQPHFIRWEYGGDFPELVVADGSHIYIYDEVLEQVTVKPQTDFATDSPLSLLTDIGRLDEQFEVRETGNFEGLDLLELRSRSAESEFDRVLLGLQDNELRMMAMEDAFGLRTEIHFDALERNQDLDAELFRFTPPPGVDVIGDMSPAAAADGGR